MSIIEQVPDDTSFIDRGLGVGSLVPTSYTNYGLPDSVNLANFTPPDRESFSDSRKRDRGLTGEQPKDIYIPKVYESFSEQNTSPFYEYGNYDINDNYTRKDDGSFVKKYDYYKHGVGGYNEANNDIVLYGIWGVIALLILFMIMYVIKSSNKVEVKKTLENDLKNEVKKTNQSKREYNF